jgi:hypothetical protein
MEETKKPENPIAFPRTAFDSKGDITTWGKEYEGMTLRDYFAAKAMQGMFTESILKISDDVVKSNYKTRRAEWFAEQSYNFADAMLKQREL